MRMLLRPRVVSRVQVLVVPSQAPNLQCDGKLLMLWKSNGTFIAVSIVEEMSCRGAYVLCKDYYSLESAVSCCLVLATKVGTTRRSPRYSIGRQHSHRSM